MNILSGTITSSTRYLDATPLYQYYKKTEIPAKYELRQPLAEKLIFFSKLDYADLVCCYPPQFLLRRLQRVQFVAATFVLVTMLRTVGMYLKSDGFQLMREEILTS